MEILHEINQLPGQANGIKSAWTAIIRELDEAFEGWPRICQQYIAEIATIEKAGTPHWQVNGQVIGKRFSIQASPLVKGDGVRPGVYAELIVSTPSINGEKNIEIGRLLLDRNFVVYSTDLETVLSDYDSGSSKLFMSIINAVLRTAAA